MFFVSFLKSLVKKDFILPCLLIGISSIQILTTIFFISFSLITLSLSVFTFVIIVVLLVKLKDISSSINNHLDKNTVKFPVLNSINTLENSLNEVLKTNHDVEIVLDKLHNMDFEHLDINTHTPSVVKSIETMDMLKTEFIKWEEEKKQWESSSWLVDGQNHISSILRNNNKDVKTFTAAVVVELLNYLNIEYGQFFMPQTENDNLLISKFNYGGTIKSFEVGQGNVGTAFKDKSTLYLKHNQIENIAIKSGLGRVNLYEVYTVPLICNDLCYGVIELGSLKSFNNLQITLIDKLSNDIAITLANILANAKNEELYKRSQEQMTQLQAKENELVQNMEELITAKDEMTEKKLETENTQIMLKNIIDNLPFPVFVKDEHSKYILANKEQGQLFGMSPDKLCGKNDEDYITDKNDIEEIRKTDKKVLLERKKLTLPEQKITFADGSYRILQTIKIPITNNVSNQINILGISHDLSAIRTREARLSEAKEIIKKLEKKIKLLEQTK